METIAWPNIIHEYNRFMGSVDLMDSSFGRNRIRVKSRKWTVRLIYHLLDLAMINTWILYKRNYSICPQIGKQLSLNEFITEVANVLCKSGVEVKRGRPGGHLESVIDSRLLVPHHAPAPPRDVRLDMVGHWSQFQGDHKNPQRCKLQCGKRSVFYCSKCGVYLCIKEGRNCFLEYHTN